MIGSTSEGDKLKEEKQIEMFKEYIPFIKTKMDVCLYSAFPTTVLKGIAVSVITLLLYQRLGSILKERN